MNINIEMLKDSRRGVRNEQNSTSIHVLINLKNSFHFLLLVYYWFWHHSRRETRKMAVKKSFSLKIFTEILCMGKSWNIFFIKFHSININSTSSSQNVHQWIQARTEEILTSVNFLMLSHTFQHIKCVYFEFFISHQTK